MADIGLSVASKITEYLAAPAIRHLGYVFGFASNVEDLKKEAEKLTVAQGRLQNDVNEAIRQTEEIERDVLDWLTDANKVLEDVKILERELEENRKCFIWCPNWHWQYRLSTKIAKQKLCVVELQGTSKFQRVGYRATLPVIEFLQSKDFMPSKSSDKAINQIMGALKDDDVSMIGLYGMAGVGKTTLAKEVGKKATDLMLFDLVVIAVVSQTPDIRKIQGRIADLLDLQFEKETEEGRAAQLWHRLQEEKKIFVILDDVWKELNLAAIGIPFGDDHKGCKVLLTTRLQHVCTRMRSQAKIQLDVLSNDEAWTLFKHNAGLDDVTGYGELDNAAQNVSRECKGLPLAIVTIARALREKTLDEWIVANQQLKRSQLVENQDYYEDIYGCLKFSYDYLKGRKIKSCFLLCSHFPEDYEVSIELLTRYAVGQGLFQDVDFIEDARRETRVIVTNLQYCGLLLDTGNAETVKMHDVVRDFAHWIASEGENQWLIKAGLGLQEWPHSESLGCCTAISLMDNKIEHLPDELPCPKLETLLLSGNHLVGLPSASFKKLKTLKVLTLSVGLTRSLEGLLPLTNLKSLSMWGCKLHDISSLGKLKKLEILDFRGCYLENLPDELGELNNLRLLDLSYVDGLWKIPPYLIQKLSKLEELYIGDYGFSQWAIEEQGEGARTASLSELKSLSRLTALTVKVNSPSLPKYFVFPKLQRYNIAINQWFDYGYPSSRSLKIAGSPSIAFKELFCNIEYLDLDSVMGHQRLVPSLDQRGLNDLTFLRLRRCRDIQCLIHTVNQQVPAIALFNLVELFMEDMIHLKELCNGLHPTGFLHKLEKFTATNCPAMISTVPVVKGLREATVKNCPRLLEVFQFDNLVHTGEENHAFLLSHLTHLELKLLPNLRCIMKGPIDRVSLQSLGTVKVRSCEKLTSLFSPALAHGLLQLETLEIHDCSTMKYVITETINSDPHPLCFPKLTTLKISSCDVLEYVFPISMAPDFPQLKEINITDSAQLKRVFGLGEEMDVVKDIVLPQLRSLVLKNLKSLSSFCPENCVLVQPSLEELEVEECPLLAPFIFEDMMRARIKKLWLCKVGNNCQPCNRVSLQGRQRSANMEALTVGNCEEIFRLEGAFFLSSLQNLRLKDLQELQVIWKGPSQIATLRNLTHLEIVECKRLRHIFSPMFAPNFLLLRDLHLQGCEELEQIIVIDQTILSSSKGDLLRPISFPNLTKIWIINCNKLKCVFPISAAHGLPKLQEFKVEAASELEHVFGHEDEANIIDGADMVLSNLKRLELLQLQSLVSFCPSKYLLMFPTWFTAIVEDCPKMTTFFTVDRNNLIPGRSQELQVPEAKNKRHLSKTHEKCFLNLKELTVKNSGVQEMFQLKGLPLPRDEHKCSCTIWMESKSRGYLYFFDFYNNVSLADLTTVELSNCKRLKHIFTTTLARNLPRLKYLTVLECEDLEQIVANDDGEERDQISASSSKGHFKSVCLCSLNKIKIGSCNRIKSLFPVSVALPKLETVTIAAASELEQLFGDEDGEAGHVLEEKQMVLPRLWMLDLLQLPSLITYCPRGYQLVVPKLSSSIVEDCPKLTMTLPVKNSEISVNAKT